jgi:hypothetical protein
MVAVRPTGSRADHPMITRAADRRQAVTVTVTLTRPGRRPGCGGTGTFKPCSSQVHESTVTVRVTGTAPVQWFKLPVQLATSRLTPA